MNWRIGLVILGLLICGWRFGSAVKSAEDIRANGSEVLFPLRPADPRELLLGDYMALRYDPESLPPGRMEASGLAVISIQDGVGIYDRLAKDGEALAPNEMLIRHRPTGRRGQASYGGTRYYFQSGTAKRYNDAEYGIFKVMPDGRALLAGLADADKKPIAIAGEASPAR